MKRRFLFMLLAALTCVGANAAILKANNYLKPSEATGTAGKTVEVNILMWNNVDIVNWQTNLVLPNGVTLVKAEAAEKWTEEVKSEGNKVFSETETAVGSNTGAVVAKLTLQIDATVPAGEYEVAFSGTVMTSNDGKTITQDDNKTAKLTVLEDVNPGIKGDVDGNGSVGLGDIEEILAIMAGGESKPAADVDGNGSVGLGDIEKILVIMAGGE